MNIKYNSYQIDCNIHDSGTRCILFSWTIYFKSCIHISVNLFVNHVFTGTKIDRGSSQTSTTRCAVRTTCVYLSSTSQSTMTRVLICVALSMTLALQLQRLESECRVSKHRIFFIRVYINDNYKHHKAAWGLISSYNPRQRK